MNQKIEDLSKDPNRKDYHIIIISSGKLKLEVCQKVEQEWRQLHKIHILQVVVYCGFIESNIGIREKYLELV